MIGNKLHFSDNFEFDIVLSLLFIAHCSYYFAAKILFSLLFNPLLDDKILGLPKLKAFADDKLNVTKNVKVVFHRIENIVGKEETAGYQHFLLFPHCFQKTFSCKSCHCLTKFMWVRKLLKIQDPTRTSVHVTDVEYQLTHYLMTNFRLFQTERVCRRLSQI